MERKPSDTRSGRGLPYSSTVRFNCLAVKQRMHRYVAGALALAVSLLLSGTSYAQNETDEPTVRHAIESVLDMDSGRGVSRVPGVSLDSATGDLPVVFAM